MLASLKMLLSTVIDYAGLFPPAKLSLQDTMTNYVRYRTSAEHWMLQHLVLPVARLQEFAEDLPRHALEQWSLSILLSQDWEAGLAAIQAFNHRKSVVTALEFPLLSPDEVEKALSQLPIGINAFFEVAFDQDLAPWLEVLKGTNASLKIRTGGVTPEAFLDSGGLSQFILSCAGADVPFKATAGLHHPLPGSYRLTGDADSPVAPMQGFLNVAIATALAYCQNVTPEDISAILGETSIREFQFEEDQITWRDRNLPLAEIEQARHRFFRSFGSCSFQEPVDDLRELSLL